MEERFWIPFASRGRLLRQHSKKMAARNTSSHKKLFHSSGSSPARASQEPQRYTGALACIPPTAHQGQRLKDAIFSTFPYFCSSPPHPSHQKCEYQTEKWRREGRSRFLSARHWRLEGGGRRKGVGRVTRTRPPPPPPPPPPTPHPRADSEMSIMFPWHSWRTFDTTNYCSHAESQHITGPFRRAPPPGVVLLPYCDFVLKQSMSACNLTWHNDNYYDGTHMNPRIIIFKSTYFISQLE